MDHPAVSSLASESSRPTATTTSVPALEKWIGRVVGAAALTVLEALNEYQDRGLTPATKKKIGEVHWRLYQVRQLLAPGPWDFDSLARIQGAAVLRAADVSPRLAEIAIDAVMETLRKVTRDALN